jgi:hypothetical protein
LLVLLEKIRELLDESLNIIDQRRKSVKGEEEILWNEYRRDLRNTYVRLRMVMEKMYADRVLDPEERKVVIKILEGELKEVV